MQQDDPIRECESVTTSDVTDCSKTIIYESVTTSGVTDYNKTILYESVRV